MSRAGLTTFVVFAGAVGAGVIAADTPPQEAPARFPSHVEQVTVDVVVTNKDGQPVTGLGKDDLEVYEDGTRQTVVSFDAVEVAAAPPAATPAARSRVSTNTNPQRRRPGRTFVILFDDLHLTPFSAQRAKAAVAEFVRKQIRPGDRVTLVAAAGGAFWTSRMDEGRDDIIDVVRRLQGRSIPDTARDRMSDYEAMRIHVYRDEMIMNRVQRRFETAGVATGTQQGRHVTGPRAVEDPVITSRAAEVYAGAAARNRITLEALERSLRALGGLEGRKSVILVSDGFIYDPQLDLFKRLVDASRASNAAIYFIDSRGLEGLPLAMTAEFSAPLPPEDIGSAFAESFETSEGAEALAADTGGFTVRNTNDLGRGFERIADETRVYYLIGYTPTNTVRDGSFRKIQVKLRERKGLRVRARKGYYATADAQPSLAAKPRADPAFQSALDSPYDVDDIGLRMTHFVREETALAGKARVLMAVEIDVTRLAFEQQDGRSVGALQMLLVTASRETGEFWRYDQKLDLKLSPDTREQLARTWLPVIRDFELVPGRYQAKIVVRDAGTGRMGTVAHDFEVPALRQFRASTPVLSDIREKKDDGSGGLALVARREFPQDAELFCQLDVYEAARLESTRMPRVSMGYEVRRSDGTLYVTDAPTLINPTPAGALSRLIGFSLAGASPGAYELVMRLKDELSGKTLELREPFAVSPAASAMATAATRP